MWFSLLHNLPTTNCAMCISSKFWIFFPFLWIYIELHANALAIDRIIVVRIESALWSEWKCVNEIPKCFG